MESTSPSPADRRRAHRRVGAAAVLAIAALMLLGSNRGAAQADTTVPTRTQQSTTPGFGFGAPGTPAPSTGGNQS